MASIVKFFVSKMELILRWILTIAMGSMVTIIMLQVIYRYVFQSPLSWSEEVARFLFVWITFIGAAAAGLKGGHISVMVLENFLKGVFKKYLKIVSFSLTSFFFGMCAFVAISVFDKMMMQTSPALGLPMGYPYFGIILGSILLCIFYAANAFLLVIKKQDGDN